MTIIILSLLEHLNDMRLYTFTFYKGKYCELTFELVVNLQVRI